MNIYRPPSVREQPEVRLMNWKVYETGDNKERHLVGKIIGGSHDGRVSSAIQKHENGIFTTRSGRKYQLVGLGRVDGDADYVWKIWCRRNDILTFTDVSSEYTGEKD